MMEMRYWLGKTLQIGLDFKTPGKAMLHWDAFKYTNSHIPKEALR